MHPVFVYTHNAQQDIEQLMRLGGGYEAAESVIETGEIMYTVGDYMSLVDGNWIRLITLTPARFSDMEYVSLVDEIRPLIHTLQPDQSIRL